MAVVISHHGLNVRTSHQGSDFPEDTVRELEDIILEMGCAETSSLAAFDW
jgi:hypothetical protein